MSEGLLLWGSFAALVLILLALDLGVFHSKAHVVSIREALTWSAVWIAVSLAFNAFVFYQKGHEAGLNFLAGYIIEKALSLDNLFVFLLIFSYFGVKPLHQHRILFWGILGALILRALCIAAGVVLLHMFHWTIYVLGAFLVYTGLKMAFEKEKEIHPERNFALILFRRFMPVSTQYDAEGRFFIRKSGRLTATPLFVALLVIEGTDVLFAVDSVPAILAITTDPFIVYSSNVFAILGLRALYFTLAGIMEMFHYLHYGLSAVLVFVGTKMLLSEIYKIPIVASLLTIAAIVGLSVALSIAFPKNK